jgi:hypothetical protein
VVVWKNEVIKTRLRIKLSLSREVAKLSCGPWGKVQQIFTSYWVYISRFTTKIKYMSGVRWVKRE